MTAVARVYRWEIAKLLAQKRTYLGLVAAVAVPIIFVVVLLIQGGGPSDVPLGRYIRDTGLAIPFVVLFFMSIWGLPLITALVAGDIVASETHNGTLKTILTRSRERGEVFAAKTLATATYTLTLALGQARIAFTALVPETASLEDLVLAMTGGESSDHDRPAAVKRSSPSASRTSPIPGWLRSTVRARSGSRARRR